MTRQKKGFILSDWPLILGGLGLSILVVPGLVYWRLVHPSSFPLAVPFGYVAMLAMAPGFLMGGVGLWMAARG